MEDEDILALGLADGYSLLLVYAEDKENGITDADLKKIRRGFDLKFDIHRLINEMYTIKHKSDEVIIGNQTYPLTDFFTEIEKRETLVKKLLLEINRSNDPLAARGGEHASGTTQSSRLPKYPTRQ